MGVQFFMRDSYLRMMLVIVGFLKSNFVYLYHSNFSDDSNDSRYSDFFFVEILALVNSFSCSCSSEYPIDNSSINEGSNIFSICLIFLKF